MAIIKEESRMDAPHKTYLEMYKEYIEGYKQYKMERAANHIVAAPKLEYAKK